MTTVVSSIVIFVLVTVVIGDQFEAHFQWKYINYSWPSWKIYEEAVRDGIYIKEHNTISGIKVWKDKVYLTIPRQKEGVPATLVTVSKNAITSPLLEPYPNWEMQRIGECSALQFAQGIEIDPQGRMWVINNGRIETRTQYPRTLCPNRLMIFGIENNGEILLDYVFPESVVRSNSAFLNNLVLDHENGGFTYIIDFNEEDPGIVVFSLREERSWKLFHESMRINSKASLLIPNGISLNIDTHPGGIALSPFDGKSDRLVYYSSVTSLEMFSVPTVILQKNDIINMNAQVRNVGRKKFPGGDMLMSSSGKLYLGYPTENAIGVWDRNNQTFVNGQKIWMENVEWTDSFAIDEFKYHWSTVKRMSVIRDGTIDIRKVNFRIIKSFINSKSYQYYDNGIAPILPEIVHSSIFRILIKNFRISLNHVRKRALSLS